MMRVASIVLSLLVLAPIAWGQVCGIRLNNQDPSNAAYVQSIGTVGPDGLTQCQMRLCSGGSLPLTGINAMPVDGNVTLVTNQYCKGFNDTILGCVPNSWVREQDQDPNWYYKGCPHCSASNTCNAAAANSATNSLNRNQFHTRYVELPFSGRTCYQLKCIQTQCLNDSTQGSAWAYVRSQNTAGPERFWFPDANNPYSVIKKNSWSVFDLPTSYQCPNTFPAVSPLLCDVTNDGSYWIDSFRFNYVNNTECAISKCAGNNAWTPIATTTSFSSGNVDGAFVSWIRKTCPNEIQGCYNTVSNWRWDHSYQTSVTPRLNCVSTNAFCSRLYCTCTTPFRYVYSIDTIMSQLSTLTASLTSTKTWGFVVPSQRQKCIRAECQSNLRLSPGGANNTVIETIYNGVMTAADCAAPTVEYYNGASATAQGVSFHSAIPMAWRRSSSYTSATYGRTTQLFCSALGYTLSAGQVVSTTSPPTCYRSSFYSLNSKSTNGGLTSYGFTTSDCNRLNAEYPWNQKTGAGCPTSSPTTMPTGGCQSNAISSTTGCYQQARVSTLDKRFIEFQCYPSRMNLKLETRCTTISSTRFQDLYDNAFLRQCYADRPAAYNYHRALTCLSSSVTYMSATTNPNDEADMRMQNNECDWFRFKQVYEKIATCECQNVERINRGGLLAYQWQMQKQFRTNFGSRIGAYSLRTLLDNLQSLGCTYQFSCASSGAATVTVSRPKFEAYYIVPTACKNVNWGTLKSNIEAVTARADIGGTTSVTSGRFGGVQMKSQDAVDLPGNKCRVKWWTYFVDPDKAAWFHGNMTVAGGSPALPKSTGGGPGVVFISFVGDSASSVRVAPASPGARHIPSVFLVLFSCVVYMLR